jgi:NAD(P) transhydrogenase subunit alpha
LTRPEEKSKSTESPIISSINLANTVPYHASQMYAKNVTTFLLYMVKEGKLQINPQDEIVRDTLLTQGGEIVNARLREIYKLPALAAKS